MSQSYGLIYDMITWQNETQKILTEYRNHFL